MGKRPRWSPEEKKFFNECVDKGMTDAQISSEFHIKTKFEKAKGFHMRTPDAMGRRRRFLAMERSPVEGKPLNHRRSWSPEDDDLLITYKDMGSSKEEMAEIFNRTERAIDTGIRYLENKDTTPSHWLHQLKGFFNHIFRRFGHNRG
jgi:hypothetical protein